MSRASGRSAPAAAAYRAAERIENARDGLVHDYRARGGVDGALVVTPAGAEWALDRSALWNAAEAAEKRKDAKVAREYELALPAELSRGQRLELVREFAEAVCERYGVAVDAAIHAPHDHGDERNHHAHVLTTTRVVTAAGLTEKTRQLDVSTTASVEVEAVRALWEAQANAALERAGEAARIDRRTLAAQGVERLPTMHLGATASALEREGVMTRRGDHNRTVANDNQVRERLSAEIVDLRAERDRRAAEGAARTAVEAPGAPEREQTGQRAADRPDAPQRGATSASGGGSRGGMLDDAAWALAGSADEREMVAGLNKLARLLRELGRRDDGPPPSAAEIVRAWETARERELVQVEARAARAERHGRELLREQEARRREHRDAEPRGLRTMVPGRRAAWEQVGAAIDRRITRLVRQLDRAEAYGRRYGGDWENGGAGERLAHAKAATAMPEVAAAYEAARVENIRQRGAEAAAEREQVRQQRREQGRGRGR